MQLQVATKENPSREVQIGLLLSVDYDGKQKKAILKFLSHDGNSILVISDPYGHKPYCLSFLSKDELLKIDDLVNLPSFDHIEEIEKFDPLLQRIVKMSKIVVQDPLGISGKPSGTVKSVLKEVWEADIPYVLNYIYDLNLRPGHYYELDLVNNSLKPIPLSIPQESEERLKQISLSSHLIDSALVRGWAYYLEQPIPEIKRVALDIEVYSKDPNVLPNAENPEDKIISVAFVDSNGKKLILLLKRNNFSEVSFDKFNATVEFFNDEKQLLIRTFQILNNYPMVITY
ncbi:MAG: 3'-5' exonuclease, partial [Thermoproteota archaeon]